MGSMEAACISGFLCRLCSEMHRTVIHIYGDQGQKHKLASKINDYLPVVITPNDPLPKTICKSCMDRVEQHHSLMTTMAKNQAVFSLRHRQAQITARLAAASQSDSSSSSSSSNSITISRNTATTAAGAIVVAAVSAAAREAERRISGIREIDEISTSLSERTGMQSIVSRLYAITELDDGNAATDNNSPSESATAT